MAGYHQIEIQKGIFGQFSKIKEEFLELEDAHNQNNRIMELVELSDLIGSIKAYLDFKYYNAIEFQDLITFSEVTKRAFECGERK